MLHPMPIISFVLKPSMSIVAHSVDICSRCGIDIGSGKTEENGLTFDGLELETVE